MHQLVIYIAKYLIFVSAAITLYVWLKLKSPQKKTFIVQAIIGGLVALVLAIISSRLYHNPRPFVAGHFTPYFFHAADNGFPSDHMLLASFVGFLCLKYNKLAGWLLLVLAVLIGGTRVIAGVHHSIDILGSLIFAAVGVAVAGWAYKAPTTKQPHHD